MAEIEAKVEVNFELDEPQEVEYLDEYLDTVTGELETCRFCIKQDGIMYEIFDETQFQSPLGSFLSIRDMIGYSVDFVLIKRDNAPSYICSSCFYMLECSCKFKTLCINSEDQLRKEYVEYPETADVKPQYDAETSIRRRKLTPEMLTEARQRIENGEKLTDVARSMDVAISTLGNKLSSEKIRSDAPLPRNPDKRELELLAEGQLTCRLCGVQSRNLKELFIHRRSHKGIQDNTCHICLRKLTTWGSLRQHMMAHLPPGYACDHCTYRAVSRYDLIKHLRAHTGVRPYRCEECMAEFKYSSNYRKHTRRHQGIVYICDYCNKSYFDKYTLAQHIDTHNNVKRYRCQKCSRSFSYRPDWAKHSFKVHKVKVTGERGRKKTLKIVTKEETQS